MKISYQIIRWTAKSDLIFDIHKKSLISRWSLERENQLEHRIFRSELKDFGFSSATPTLFIIRDRQYLTQQIGKTEEE